MSLDKRPIDDGIEPFNWLLYSPLPYYQFTNTTHTKRSYNFTSPVMLPIDDGIEPFNRLFCRYLQEHQCNSKCSHTISIVHSARWMIVGYCHSNCCCIEICRNVSTYERMWAYKIDNALSFAIDDGIVPVKWLSARILQTSVDTILCTHTFVAVGTYYQ